MSEQSSSSTRATPDERSRLLARIAQAAADFGDAAQVVDDAAARALGVNRTDLRVIGLLHARGPMTAGALARAVGLSPAATTTAIARLTAAGHASRATDPADRRRAVVALSAGAARLVDTIYGALARAGLEHLDGYTQEQLDLIESFLRRGEQLQLEAAARAPARAGPAD